MAKISSIEKNKRRKRLVKSLQDKRKSLKEQIYNKELPLEERFYLVTKLSALPRNSARTRIRNRCEITGRARAVYAKFNLSRNVLRDLAGKGMIPGLRKGSW